MIPTSIRLTSKEVEYVLKKGASLSTEFFIVKYLSNKESKSSKFAVVTSAKLSAKAVERNLIRRRTYEAIRLNYEVISLNKDNTVKYLLAFIPKKRALKAEYKEIEADIKILFTQLEKNG